MEIQQEKTCIKCKNSKPISDFPLRVDSLDGHRNACFPCEEIRKEAARNRAKIASQILSSEKFCYKCQTSKPITDFSKRGDSPDGRRAYCKKCEFGGVKGIERPAGLSPRIVDLPDGKRVCSKCGVPKEIDHFRKAATAKGGRGGECKECALIRSTALANKYRASGFICKEGTKTCYLCKKEKTVEEFGINRRNKDGRAHGCLECTKVKSYMSRVKNIESVRESARKSAKKRRLDINNRLKQSLRALARGILKKGQKAGSGVRDLGCSIEEFKKHIESLWRPGMTWENYGQWSWVIDHIMPLDYFDLTDRKQVLVACHYTNLQPMWWNDNIAKGSKMPWEFTQPLSDGPAPRPRERLKGQVNSGENRCEPESVSNPVSEFVSNPNPSHSPY